MVRFQWKIARPAFRRQGNQVYFHLLEYNRYALETGSQTVQEDFALDAMPGAFLLEPLGGMGAGGFASMAGSSSPGKAGMVISFDEYPSMPWPRRSAARGGR